MSKVLKKASLTCCYSLDIRKLDISVDTLFPLVINTSPALQEAMGLLRNPAHHKLWDNNLILDSKN